MDRQKKLKLKNHVCFLDHINDDNLNQNSALKEFKPYFIGVDEVGRGPIAGPVVAAALILPIGYTNSEIKDSKLLSLKKREELDTIIRKEALAYCIVAVGPRRIEKINILNATKYAMRLCINKISKNNPINYHAIIDGNFPVDISIPQKSIIEGDKYFIQISGASIIAKVYRDNLMNILSIRYPGYGFHKNSGYPTPSHLESINNIGISKIHRRTFKGVKEFYLSENL